MIIDSWSPQGQKYTVLGALGFFLDSNFKLHMFSFPFTDISADQSSQALHRHLNAILSKYQLADRCIAITGDNGGHLNVSALMDELGRGTVSTTHRPIFFARCLAHILNLVVSHIFDSCKATKSTATINKNSQTPRLTQAYLSENYLQPGRLDHIVSPAFLTNDEVEEEGHAPDTTESVHACLWKVRTVMCTFNVVILTSHASFVHLRAADSREVQRPKPPSMPFNEPPDQIYLPST